MTEDQEFELLERKAASARKKEMELKAWHASHRFVDEGSTIGSMSIVDIYQEAYIKGFMEADKIRSSVAK